MIIKNLDSIILKKISGIKTEQGITGLWEIECRHPHGFRIVTEVQLNLFILI